MQVLVEMYLIVQRYKYINREQTICNQKCPVNVAKADRNVSFE